MNVKNVHSVKRLRIVACWRLTRPKFYSELPSVYLNVLFLSESPRDSQWTPEHLLRIIDSRPYLYSKTHASKRYFRLYRNPSATDEKTRKKNEAVRHGDVLLRDTVVDRRRESTFPFRRRFTFPANTTKQVRFEPVVGISRFGPYIACYDAFWFRWRVVTVV